MSKSNVATQRRSAATAADTVSRRAPAASRKNAPATAVKTKTLRLSPVA
jgi:hypothetical protein